VILCDFGDLTIGDQNEYDKLITVRDYSIWVSGTESRWADPDPVRILKWLTVSFRKECPTGDEALWGCTVQVQTGLLCKNASIVRSRS